MKVTDSPVWLISIWILFAANMASTPEPRITPVFNNVWCLNSTMGNPKDSCVYIGHASTRIAPKAFAYNIIRYMQLGIAPGRVFEKTKQGIIDHHNSPNLQRLGINDWAMRYLKHGGLSNTQPGLWRWAFHANNTKHYSHQRITGDDQAKLYKNRASALNDVTKTTLHTQLFDKAAQCLGKAPNLASPVIFTDQISFFLLLK